LSRRNFAAVPHDRVGAPRITHTDTIFGISYGGKRRMAPFEPSNWNAQSAIDVINAKTIKHAEIAMDWNRIEGNWKQVKGKVKEKWGQLTDDNITQVNGNRDQLEGKLQQRYGLAKDMMRKDVDAWLKSQP
jgi:uncharacterized protein YjbJ (UPF0337 family)